MSREAKEALLNLMIMKNYEIDVADFALRTVKYKSVERAVAYLTETDERGQFMHPFVPMSDICKLCYHD